MILSEIKDLKMYNALHKDIIYINNFLIHNNLLDYEPGRYDFKNDIYFNIDAYTTKNLSEAIIENHQKYIDLQIMLHGNELIGYKNLNNTKSINYNPVKDIEFFDKPDIFLPFYENFFMIFFSTDGHAPCLNIDNKSQNVKKVVFKIPHF